MLVEPMNGFAEQVPLSGPVASPAPETGLTVRNGLLLALGYAPLLCAFFLNLWARPHYQFFPLALAGAAFLAWTRLKESRVQSPESGVQSPESGVRSLGVRGQALEGGGGAGLVLLGFSFLLLAA